MEVFGWVKGNRSWVFVTIMIKTGLSEKNFDFTVFSNIPIFLPILYQCSRKFLLESMSPIGTESFIFSQNAIIFARQ